MTNPYSHAAVRDWLQSISANDLGSSKRLVVSVSADDNIADAWRTLIANKILGAPVFDEKTKKYIGMFDVSDVVHVLFTPLDEVAKKDGLKEAMNELLAKQNVRDVLSADEPAHTFHHLSDTASLLDVMKKMVAERAHRICLVDKDQKLCNIVTQSTVIEFLAANRSKIQELAKVTPEQVALHNVWADVVMFNQSEKALHAFRKLRAHHVSGAAIVDDDKKLVGNLSVRDLKIIEPDTSFFGALLLTLKGFQTYLKEQSQRGSEGGAVHYERSTPLGDVIAILAEKKVHRIYLCDSKGHVEGVTSLVDILKIVCA